MEMKIWVEKIVPVDVIPIKLQLLEVKTYNIALIARWNLSMARFLRAMAKLWSLSKLPIQIQTVIAKEKSEEKRESSAILMKYLLWEYNFLKWLLTKTQLTHFSLWRLDFYVVKWFVTWIITPFASAY